MRVWSVGHSTHTLDGFVALLTAHGIALVADIRAVPRSRRHPWFHSDALVQSLPDHAAGLAQLRELAAAQPTAMMCSEALWWRCHRRLVADRLVAIGDIVCHIGSDGRASPHRLASFAAVTADGQLTYPGAP
jgi:uncharacterized protein (DUF488 family)